MEIIPLEEVIVAAMVANLSEDTIACLRDYRAGDVETEDVYHLGTLGLVEFRRNWRRHAIDSWLTERGAAVLAAHPAPAGSRQQ